MIPSFDPALWRRASWTVLSLAVIAFVCLGLAEQGSRGGGLLTPPDQPLPFERHRIFGLDLGELSSLQARDWLNAAGNPSLALILVPIDADVVESLAQEDRREEALVAVDSLVQAAGASPIAVCLRRPPEVVGGLGIAQAAVSAITSSHPDRVIYASACDPSEHPAWQGDIDEAARPDAEAAAPRNALVPLAGGPIVMRERLGGTSDLDAEHFRLHARGYYATFRLDSSEPLSAETVGDAGGAMADTSHSALVLVAPTNNVDPAALTTSIANASLTGDSLPEGFSGVNAPGVHVNDQWQHTVVGTVSYLRATNSEAAISAEFVGTDVYVAGIESPESGLLNVWIDPESPTAVPTVVLDLASFQARDAAIPIASGLPAARHEITIQAVVTEGQSVTISGLFVTGKPPTAWTGLMAAGGLLLAAVAALSERCYTAISAIRRRTGPPRRRPRPGHPRVFTRDH